MLKLAVVASERKVGPSKSEREYGEDQCVVMETQPGVARRDVWAGLVLKEKCCLGTLRCISI